LRRKDAEIGAHVAPPLHRNLPFSVHSSAGWILLLACVVVQLTIALVGTPAALAVVGGTTLLHLALAWRDQEFTVPEGAALVAFWIAAGTIIVVHRRLTERLARLAQLCDVDETTGCLNRRGFSREFDDATMVRGDSVRDVALLALDLDHFKQVNDRFGHLRGDEVLHEVGASLLASVGDNGVVARMGGEEFAVLLPGMDAEEAGVVAEQLLVDLRDRRFTTLPDTARITMSVGIAAERLAHDSVAASLRARADEALYAAKRSGRDRALLWAPGVHSHATPPTAGLAIRHGLRGGYVVGQLHSPAGSRGELRG
jgi:diguanylate cyclase (GGDEF)-like protein